MKSTRPLTAGSSTFPTLIFITSTAEPRSASFCLNVSCCFAHAACISAAREATVPNWPSLSVIRDSCSYSVSIVPAVFDPPKMLENCWVASTALEPVEAMLLAYLSVRSVNSLPDTPEAFSVSV